MAKSQFLANMSHELRTPFNAIIGFSEVRLTGIRGPLRPEQVEYVGLIHQRGEHLHDVINDILDLAKVDAGKFELREEERDRSPRHRQQYRHPNEESRDCGRDQPVDKHRRTTSALLCDSTRLKQILLNLISNAIKFTRKPGGTVVIAAHGGPDGTFVFQVRDTGLGMTEDEIEIALQPFGQVDDSNTRRYEGTGLGLPLAKRLAELHGGSLEFL